MSGPQQPPPIATQGTFFANSSMHTPLTPDYDDVESPSLTSGNALARFEFEKPAGDKRSGTKILMVEWEDDEQTKHIPGQWTVSWEGKKAAVLNANATDGSREGLHRLYFLLSVVERVPGTVTLTLQSEHQKEEKIVWRTHPLPAIFPPELGASARQAGKKGVLHTVWAKKRLQVLKQEIQHEEQYSPEGVALSMAMQERDWIESNFGVRTKPHGLKIATTTPSDTLNLGLPSPASPRSPGRGPLLEKLKGLKLDTEASKHDSNPLSPEGSDVAVNFNTFAALHGLPDPSTLSAKSAQHPSESGTTTPQPQRRIASQLPPESILAQQRQQQAGNSMASLNAFAVTEPPVEFKAPSADSVPSSLPRSDSLADEDDLFALPLSPRSPAGTQTGGSAFSFAIDDVARYKQ
ncbi:hypothetical protein D6C86_03051 [Aureobasidium pullulans]|uniref:Uncharacterized protein n=1 Tax=Aureobasidium pullulans TaxID=5580 RepID=A0A4S8YMD4_AURPU|nr:hypothetical protein D6D21_00332 [Aureobasidium pullulans]THW62226.1 hypothetical protein D6D25_02332 [Aureobasidium pullulans]THY76025.1 hypothetical protein D6C94_03479 [Aureobasidium pullulans]THZ45233.1 hypothetical protein D6C87_02968 [Aureobasidium pullulans]THZ63693.1 hypothetical protein D6C86_03051 [Aureobasidium pullulans]